MTCAQTVDIGACSTSGTNSHTNSTNYVVQYPKPYRRTDGKWIALGTLLGSLVGASVNRSIIKQAQDAENNWKDITDRFRDKGLWLFEDHAEKLVACTDMLHEKLCRLAECGYKPDFEDMFIRVRANALAVTELERRKACRTSHRYKTGMNNDLHRSLALAQVQAATSALSTAVDTARRQAFEINYKMLADVSRIIESDHLARLDRGRQYMADAANSYSKLSASLRETAKADTSDWTSMGASLAVILPLLLGFFKDDEDTCGDSTTDTGTADTGATP